VRLADATFLDSRIVAPDYQVTHALRVRRHPTSLRKNSNR
jgi:hypothetical protein